MASNGTEATSESPAETTWTQEPQAAGWWTGWQDSANDWWAWQRPQWNSYAGGSWAAYGGNGWSGQWGPSWSGDQGRAKQQSASTMAMEEDPWLGEGTGSLDDGSSSKATSSKASGKDFIPEYDGTGPMREYQRRSLKHPDGVTRLLDHLWKELEPLEFLRTFQTLADFYKGFRRTRGQEFVAYDMEFRRHGQRLEEIQAGLSGVTKAYWFLEKAGLSPELRKQVVAAAGGQYDYNKLRAAVMAIVPQVNKEEESSAGGSANPGRQWRKAPAKVHATVEDENIGTGETEEDNDDMIPEALEEELQCLLTQAAKKRAQVEKARGFSSTASRKNETPEARAKRIAELKQRMPCSACKSHGRTSYGHWHSDPECPFRSQKPPKTGESVLAVVEEELSDSDGYGPLEASIFMTDARDVSLSEPFWCASAITAPEAGKGERFLALSDTCCARSVAGLVWAQDHIKHLHQSGIDAYIVNEARPFRFGAGPRISSEFSMVIPLRVQGAECTPWVRISVVDQEVPLLLSKSALKALGARLDLGQAQVEFTVLGTTTPLIETPTGLCGFLINHPEYLNSGPGLESLPPREMLEGELEVCVDPRSNDQGEVGHHESVHVAKEGGGMSDGEYMACERLAKELLRVEDFSYDALQSVVELLPCINPKHQRAINVPNGRMAGIMAGAWAHGKFSGVAKSAERFPVTIRYINEAMKSRVQAPWTSFVVMKNIKTAIHKDNHNRTDSATVTVSFGDFKGGELWVAAEGSESGDKPTYRKGFRMALSRGPETGGVCRATLPVLREILMTRTSGNTVRVCQTSPDDQVTEIIPMAAKFTAPRRKEEYVNAINARTNLSTAELRQHDMERLKKIWMLVRPKKPQSPLPTGWKKMDVESLKQIYDEHVRPDLERPRDRHWIRWNRPQLVMEISIWETEVMEGAEPEELFHDTPLCSRCKIPMCVRTNRVTKTDFLGCVRFPMCKETLPLQYNGMPTKTVIEQLDEKDNKKDKKGYPEPKRGIISHRRPPPSLSEHRGGSSDGSWAMTGAQPVDETEAEESAPLINTNLTPEELEVIAELRKARASESAISGENGSQADEICNDSDGDELIEDAPMGDTDAPMRTGLAHDGISFDIPAGRRLSPEIRNGLKREPSRWVGPGYIVGIQGHNAWVAIGGRCFLVAGEHLREACGDERHYGDPQIQKSIAMFRKAPKESTFEDLTRQQDPTEEPMEVEQQPLVQEVAREVGDVEEGITQLPRDLVPLVGKLGWHVDGQGNPTLVSYQSWAYRTPEERYEPHRFPYRTTWARHDGEWICLEKEVKWMELDNPHEYLPNAPLEILITSFQGRTRKEVCLEDVPAAIKRRKADAQVHTVQHGKVLGKNKLKKMMEKEIPYEKIPESQRGLYKEAEEKEWASWRQYESCEVLSEEESRRVERESPKRILPSRFVYRNKHAGLVDDKGNALPVRAKARLCLQGHLCPDSRTGLVQVDSPTVERVSTMIFLHMAISYGWLQHWHVGDISNAFLQGAPLKDKEPMFMRPPKQGLAGVKSNQLLRLLKPVYGRPDAPRAWYEELAKVLTQELGFTKSHIDPALFMLRDSEGKLIGCMIIHVDDLMVCHDGSDHAKEVVSRLCKRFPFGTWDRVLDKPEGVTYCGKEIKVVEQKGEQQIVLSQDGFIDGRLEEMEVSRDRRLNPESYATDEEKANYRSIVGSLQWLATQSRPDSSFETNQLQKRISANRMQLVFKNLGRDAQLIVYTDAGLYSSVGVEIDERECDDILLSQKDRRLVYSQKGAFVGFVKQGSTDVKGVPNHINIIDWRSSTNKRVIESSFAGETHAALMALGMGHFCQVLMCELRYGSQIVSSVDDDGWCDLMPMTVVTDCKSIYDTVHKDGQHISDKSSVIHAVLLRQMLSTRGASGKARLLWVPTRHQLADGLTKGARSKDVREQIRCGVVFKEEAAKRKCSDPKEILVSVDLA
ncbi:RE2 [Symbiodinium sp. CCMP2592]|nr:RE2 [Symbiodinium sp. CCMP2592]